MAEAGWAGKSNGELLRLAAREFDAFVSTDKGIPHQQNVSRFDLAVVLLRATSNAREDLTPLMDEVDAALGSVEPGTVVRVPGIGEKLSGKSQAWANRRAIRRVIAA